MLYQSEGIVLDLGDLGENDKLAIIFTRQEGLVKAVVKGAGRPQSKLRSLTQPFTHSIFQLFRGRTFDRVTQASVQNAYPGIMEDYNRMIYACYIAELIISVLPERARDQNQFKFLLAVLSCLEQKDDPWLIARWAELGILSMAGFAPSFSHCTSCGKEYPDPPVYFSLRDGGAICSQCIGEALSQAMSPGTAGGGTPSSGFASESQVRSYGEIISISPGALRTLEILAGEITSTDFPAKARCPNISARGQVRKEISAVSRKYVSFVLEKRLKSANLVESIEDEK